jgi:hypothetical protein
MARSPASNQAWSIHAICNVVWPTDVGLMGSAYANVLAVLSSCCLFAGRLNANEFARLSEQAAQIEDRCFRKASYFGQEQMKCGFAAEARKAQLVKLSYAAAHARTPAAKRKAFAALQRRWTAATERECRRAAVFSPAPIGTIATVEGLMCLSHEYSMRIDWLERQYRTQKPRR